MTEDVYIMYFFSVIWASSLEGDAISSIGHNRVQRLSREYAWITDKHQKSSLIPHILRRILETNIKYDSPCIYDFSMLDNCASQQKSLGWKILKKKISQVFLY